MSAYRTITCIACILVVTDTTVLTWLVLTEVYVYITAVQG